MDSQLTYYCTQPQVKPPGTPQYCGEIAHFLVKFPSGYERWMCAECYDTLVKYWRRRLLELRYTVDEERYARALSLNGESVNR